MNNAGHKEPSAQDREMAAKRERWAAMDRAELQGKGQAHKQAAKAKRTERWRKSWPWFAFFGVAAVLITLSRVLGS